MHRSRRSRLVTLAVGLGILAASLASPTLAADTRSVFVGSPGAGGGDGVLTLSPVSAGQATKTDIRIANDSQATMNKTTLTIGTAPAPALPAGVTVFGAYGPNGSACIVAAGGASVTCAFGNVRSGTERNVTIVFEVGSAGSVAIEASVKVKETVNDNGANKDTFPAVGSVAVGAFSCDSVATFVAPGQGKTVSTSASVCDPQSTALTIPALGAGALVSINEVADASCSGSRTCFGQASVANVNDGAPVNLTWAITWNNAVLPNGFNPRKAGVLHFLDNGQIVVIENTNAGKCGNSPSKTNCVVSVVEGATTTTITFRTPSNGRVKGFG